jgi:hypothetical protein
MKQVPVQCKPKDVQSLQSSYFLVFYHFRFETTTLTFSGIIYFDDYLLARKKQIDGNFRSQKEKSGTISCLM